jgi:hypothetical protein
MEILKVVQSFALKVTCIPDMLYARPSSGGNVPWISCSSLQQEADFTAFDVVETHSAKIWLGALC